jgi:hypothetical protein
MAFDLALLVVSRAILPIHAFAAIMRLPGRSWRG